jgi:DNA-binding CsgD family transcriptional regulator
MMDPRARFPALTQREAEILALLAQGASNAHVAGALGVTERTVKNTLPGVYRKVGAGNGGSARVRAALLTHGLPVVTSGDDA